MNFELPFCITNLKYYIYEASAEYGRRGGLHRRENVEKDRQREWQSWKVLRGKTFDWCTVTWSAFSLTSEPWRLRGLLTVPSDCQWYTRSCRAGASWKSWKSWSRCAARISSTLQALRALARASRFALKNDFWFIFGPF